MSLRSKFLTVCLLLITVPFLISGMITYEQYSHAVEKDTRNYVKQLTEQIRMNLDNYIKDLDQLTIAPYYQSSVITALANHNKPWKENVYVAKEELLNINLYLSSLGRKTFVGLALLANDGSLFSNSNNITASSWTEDNLPALELVRAKDGRMVVLPPHIAYYYDEPVQVFSIARLIREPGTNQPLGIIKIDLNEQAFEHFMASVNLGTNSTVQVMNAQGEMFFPRMGGSEVKPEQQRSGTIDRGKLMETNYSTYTGLYIVGLLSKSDINKDAEKLVSSTVYLSLLSLLVAYAIAAIFSNQLVKPIRKLQMSMKRIGRGIFTERATVSTKDEMGQLAEGFNLMVGEIDRLVNEVYETSLRERESEITALQSQINPHFMYNTLELINMMALRHSNLDVSDVVTSFGRLLRYTVDKKRRPVRLKEEFMFAEAYMQIQSYRLGESVSCSIDLHPELEQCWVPKLILQPLVENAIQHGIGDSGGAIEISAKEQNGCLIVSVRDDGKGVSPDALKSIYSGLESPIEEAAHDPQFGEVRKGYALYNLFRRIRLLYGEPYGLYIDESVHKGSRFYLKLPLTWELEEQRIVEETGEDHGLSSADR